MLTVEYRINGLLIAETTITLQGTRDDGLSMYAVQHWKKDEHGDIAVTGVNAPIPVWHKRNDGAERLVELSLQTLRERAESPKGKKRK